MKPLILLVWLLYALPLAAQQVVSISSGEHEGFSRLVLQLDPAVEWEVVDTRGLATLRFPHQALNFSTARVFDKISTDRIVDLTGTTSDSGSELRVALNCRCDVKTFPYLGKYIVVDVFDGPPLEPEISAEAAPQWQPDSLPFVQMPNSPLSFSAYVMATAPMQPRLLPDPKPAEPPAATPTLSAPAAQDSVADVAVIGEGGDVLPELESMVGTVVSDMNTDVEAQDDPEMLARIEEAQSQLLAQLTRAADQGLVNFVPAPVENVEVDPPMSELEPALQEAPPEIDPLLLHQLSARTAYESGQEDALSEIINKFAMPQCLDDSTFFMDGWGGEEGFSAQLAKLRRQLLGEFDAPDPKVAEEIVQLYLRYGLGAEARLMLQEIDVKFENSKLYNDLAALIEGEPELVAGPVLEGAGCGGAHEMWFLVAGLGTYQVLDPLTITDAFSTYPIEVRTQIGPALAQAFIDRGQMDEAHVVLEIVRRAESGVTSEQRMAEAQVMEAHQDLDGAALIYRDLATGNSESAPTALLAYARVLLKAKKPVPPSLLLDLESAAFFNRETPHADSLRLSEIRVRNAVEGADKALAQLAENLKDRPHITGELRQVAAEIFEEASAEQMGDYPYAEIVLQYADLLEQGPEGDAARLKIAEEMAGIGLPEKALDVLTPNLSRGGQDAHRLEAAAFVQLYQPRKALDILDGDNGVEAYKIRLSAYLQMEDFAAVAEMLNEDHAKDISINDVALRAGDWEKIQDAGAVGTLASYMQGGTAGQPDQTLAPMVADEAPSLRAARALLATNQESMAFLESVLAEGDTTQP
jgi:hypothetical protein